MGKFSTTQLHGMTIRESADDGSDFTNPAADYRRLFLGEDGTLKTKDSAGTVATVGGGGISATLFDAKGDLIAASAADTAARLAAPTSGKVLIGSTGEATGLKWSGGLYVRHRLMASAASETLAVDSTTYAEAAVLDFYHDSDFFPFTHFAITGFMASSTAGQTVTFQVATQAAPTNPISAGGDDLAINSTLELKTSGWIAVSDAISGFTAYTLAVKGSNSTVDLLVRHLDLHMKIAS